MFTSASIKRNTSDAKLYPVSVENEAAILVSI